MGWVSATGSRVSDFDLIIAGDMSGGSDLGLRMGLEARGMAAHGHRVGLVNLAAQPQGAGIDPDVQACVTRGFAHPIGPGDRVTTDRMTLHCDGIDPRNLAAYPVEAGRIDIVFDDRRAANPLPLQKWLASRTRQVRWAARTSRLASMISSHSDDLEASEGFWAAPIPKTTAGESGILGRKVAVGHVCIDDRAWPDKIEDLVTIFPADGSFDVLFLGSPPPRLRRFPNQWKVFEKGETSMLRFLERLDALVVLGARPDRYPDTAIAWMRCQGRLVYVPPGIGAEEVVPGVLPTASERIPLALRRWIAQRPKAVTVTGSGAGGRKASVAADRRKGRRKTEPQASPSVVFVASNGVGLGHVTRLLAIARRCDRVEPVFVTQSPVAALIESYGFAAHYLPSPKYVSAALRDWDAWYQTELEAIVDLTNAGAVVYDGNAPTPGLVRAAGSRGADLVWVRGGMLGAARVPMLDNDRFCDAVVEPGELADEMDTGLTRGRRDGVDLVDPILLLDREELLPREEAQVALGLDPTRPAVLIQLGSATNRDVVAIVDQLMPVLRRQSELQVVVADWFVGEAIEPVWDGVRLMRGHPFSRYFHAFDFSFAAAGYNTFHEVLAAGLPTVFVANRHSSMDDQDGRARFAEAKGFGLRLDTETMPQLDEIVAVLMNQTARDYLRRNCQRHRRPNGAVAAAQLISARALRDRSWTWPAS